MNNETCLTDGCERAAHTRGCCKSCYMRHMHAVNKDKTTWEELEARGATAPTIWEAANLCLTVNCKNKSKSRGLCDTCCSRMRKLVAKGETSWEKLEREGKSLPIRSLKLQRGAIEQAEERRRLKALATPVDPDAAPPGEMSISEIYARAKAIREGVPMQTRNRDAIQNTELSLTAWEREYWAGFDRYQRLLEQGRQQEAATAFTAWQVQRERAWQ